MRLLISIILLLPFYNSFSQKVLNYKEICGDLENSSESLNTTLYLPNSDFVIGLTKDAIIENLELDPCIDIESDIKKNDQVIGLLKKYNLTEKLYVEINNNYTDLNSDHIFKPNETVIYLELFFKTREFGYINCYVPIFERNKAIELINDLRTIFKNKYCFKELKNKI